VHPSYGVNYLIDVSFTIFNTLTQETRVVGVSLLYYRLACPPLICDLTVFIQPYGNGEQVNVGTNFYIPRPAALAGYVQTSGQSAYFIYNSWRDHRLMRDSAKLASLVSRLTKSPGERSALE
jgi:hypothetical protein